MKKFCVLGASLIWTHKIVTDLLYAFEGEQLEIRLVDISRKAAELCAQWGEAANKHHSRNDRYIPFTDRKEALRDSDAVIICLSTGGIDAMEHDIAIPEKYGIYTTVGDTTGPGGWSRSIRNIPVFMDFAKDFQRICPKALIANYTNPIASLTATLQLCCDNPAVGLCHSYFETKDVIQQIFGLKDWSEISISIAGVNHFTWVTDFKIGTEDGYELLREKIGYGSLKGVLPEKLVDEIDMWSGVQLCVELFDVVGYLPYPADRHISEFVSFALAGCGDSAQRVKPEDSYFEMMKYCNVPRTPISFRRNMRGGLEENMKKIISGEKPMPKKSRETAADMIRAYLRNEFFTDAVNVLNVGQIPGLPNGCCVETLGTVDGLGVRPLIVNKIAEDLLEIIRKPAMCQKWVTSGIIERNKKLVLDALYHDPLCAHLKPHEIRQMASELFEANEEFVSF